MSQKSNIFNKDQDEIFDENPIIIPSESFIEGYLKSSKSLRLECSFTGTIFTSKKLTIEKSAIILGDVICQSLKLEGVMDGNIFCSGHVEFCEDSIFNGKIYTSTFMNFSQDDSDFVVQIPKNSILNDVVGIINNLDTKIGLTADSILDNVRSIFYKNVFSARTNPDEIITNPFTEQLENKKLNSLQKNQTASIKNESGSIKDTSD